MRRSESDPEQHSRYLIAEARKLGIDLRVDENLEREAEPNWVHQLQRRDSWCTSYSGGDDIRRIISNLKYIGD